MIYYIIGEIIEDIFRYCNTQRKRRYKYQEFDNLIDNKIAFFDSKESTEEYKRNHMLYPYRINSILLLIFSLVSIGYLFSQYKWTRFEDNPDFNLLSDPIDNSQVISHEDAKNRWSPSDDKGMLFSARFSYYPSQDSSIEWINEIRKKGRISFYPHIYNEKDGKSSLIIAILYYIEKAVSYKQAYSAPEFIRSDILEFDSQTINFETIKFISGDFVLSIPLDLGDQEVDVRKNGNTLNYSYWVKSNVEDKKVKEIRSFFRNPFEELKIRAYTDKGYIDTTIDDRKLKKLSHIFSETSDLSEAFKKAYAIKLLSQQPKFITNTVTNTVVQTNTVVKRPRIRKRRILTTEPQTVVKEVAITNQRPVSSRIVMPR